MAQREHALAITRVKFERFTAFERLDFPVSPGLNVLVGANGTGKTHLMKVIYAACDVSKTKAAIGEKLIRVFMPSGLAIGRLVKRHKVSTRCALEVHRAGHKLRVSFSSHSTGADSADVTGARSWAESPVESVYIPVKERLANAPGFRSLYAQREIHFEEIYADILDRAYQPSLKGPTDSARKQLLSILRKAIEGKVTTKDEEFFLRNKQGNLEFSLLAEGMRKLGLLWLLIQNGALLNGSVLFWDEPETNLNPRLFGPLMEILLKLQRTGVQIFLATHSYVILKELDLRATEQDAIFFHSFHRELNGGAIACHTTPSYLEIHPNAIAEAFDDLYEREVTRSLGGAVG